MKTISSAQVALLFALVACDRCGCAEPLARLIAAEGEVTRDHDATREAWEQAASGAQFEFGDGLKTGSAGEARVAFSSGGGITLQADTLVRFLARRPEDQAQELEIETGEAQVVAGTAGSLRVLGQDGIVVIMPGSSASITAGEGGVSVSVRVGQVQIEREGAETVVLDEGDELVIGGVRIERDEPDAGPDAGVDAGPDAGVDAGPPVELIEIRVGRRGRVDVQEEGGRWRRLRRGTAQVPAGTKLRMRRRSRATVTRGSTSIALSGAQGVLGGAHLVTIRSGRATVRGAEGGSALGVPGGVVWVGDAQGRAEVTMRRGDAHVSVRRGGAELRGSRDQLPLRVGQKGTLRRNGSVDGQNRAPARAHLAVTAGSSATIHDTGRGLAVRIQFSSACPGEGVVETGRAGAPSMRSFGTGAANIALRPGRNSYRVRCVTGGVPARAVAARGRLTVRRDSGRAHLPRRASRTTIDMDGRRYTLLYQNILPIVSLRWRDAPSASRFVLHFEPQRGQAQTFPLASARHTLESGDVPEGTHRFWFEAPGGAPGRSATTTLAVAYDNATQAASIREPAGHVARGPVRVSGIATEGVTVTVNGQTLPLDGQRRFSGTATVPADLDGLAIRLVHPRTGVHYYVRRVGGSN